MLDESRWFAIYRLLNIIRMAGRRDTLSLPTSVHVERDGFSPPSPSARPSGLPQILDSPTLICACILAGTTSAVPEQSPSTECLLTFHLHFAGRVWSLGGPGDLPVLGLVDMCVWVLSWYMCSTPRSCDTGCRIPQNCGFQPKALCLDHRRAVRGAAKPGLQAEGSLVALHLPSPAEILSHPPWYP